jgi:putative ABC transport system permease protein
MSFLPRLRLLASRLGALLQGGSQDREFAQELEAHLAMLADENERHGMTPDDARRAARLRVGNPVAIHQQHREVRGMPHLESLLQDLRFAFRLIVKDRWFSAAAIAALALGIGANATGFTIVNAAFLRGLPFDDADGLYALSWQSRTGRRGSVSYADLRDWRERTTAFSGLAAYATTGVNVSDDRTLPDTLMGARITANMFALLHVRPLLGRDFNTEDDAPGAEPVVMIAARVWRERFAGDPAALGQTMRLDGRPSTIVGIAPDAMGLPEHVEIWMPLGPTAARDPRDARSLGVLGRLDEGASRARAQGEMDGIARQLAAAHPDSNAELLGIRVETVTDRFIGGPARTLFLVTMGVVGFVLLIACANVANLLLSRSIHRAREIAMRIALGASRARVVQQLLVESLLLACCGGALGLLLAAQGVGAFAATVQDAGKPFWIVFTLDWVVVAYVAVVCLATAVLFGLAPALHVSKRNTNELVKEGGRGSAGSPRLRWFTGTMVVAELALTVVLLTGAGLMVRSFANVVASDSGVDGHNLLAMKLQLPERRYPDADARRVFYDRLDERLAAIPGIETAAMTTAVPPFNNEERTIEIEGRRHSPDERPLFVSAVTISPTFFDVVGADLLAGRGFLAVDGGIGAEAVVVNQRLVDRYFGGENPLGRRIRFAPSRGEAPSASDTPWSVVVGVSPSIRHSSPRDFEPDPVVYLPRRQNPPAAASLMLRTPLPAESVMNEVRLAVQAIDRDQPVFTIQTYEQLLLERQWGYRAFGAAFSIFALIGLALSAVGLYAVMARAVAQRTHEIGVRIAVGADPWQVSWLILGRGLRQLGVGLAVGLGGALALSQVLRSVLVHISPADPMTFAAVTGIASVVTLAACLLPARRAARLDPVVALRAD